MTQSFRSVRDLEVRGKRVILREDLNLPIVGGKVGDTTRLEAALPTIRLLQTRGARLVIVAHLGRPKGRAVEEASLRPVAALLGERLGLPVAFAPDCIGSPARDAVATLHDGDVLMLENLRFHPEEEKNNPSFARALASLGELYVNDAFGTAHRAHASTVGITQHLPSAAGLLLEAELTYLTHLTDGASSPYICVIGGSKVSDKVRVLESLLTRVDAFIVGGGMANTFLAAQGIDVGSSLRESDLSVAEHILALAKERGVAIHLPSDVIAAPHIEAEAQAAASSLADLGDRAILDIGPETAQHYASILHGAKTIIFNGPMGVYERPAFRQGTAAICAAIAEATKNGATTVVGGGDAAAAARLLGYGEAFSHISTGGGAMLEYLEGKVLPAIEALNTSAGSLA